MLQYRSRRLEEESPLYAASSSCRQLQVLTEGISVCGILYISGAVSVLQNSKRSPKMEKKWESQLLLLDDDCDASKYSIVVALYFTNLLSEVVLPLYYEVSTWPCDDKKMFNEQNRRSHSRHRRERQRRQSCWLLHSYHTYTIYTRYSLLHTSSKP